MKELHVLKDQFENFLNATVEARSLSERDTDYDDHYQWTEDEKEALEARKQQPSVNNRIKKKINTLTGIQHRMRTKPRALPRTPEHEGAADAATKALRFVTDNVDFPQVSSEAFRRQMVWGYGGAIVEVEPKGDEIEIVINEIPPEWYYFDPHSRKRDFSDKTFDGIALWMDAEEAKALFPGNDDLIDAAFQMFENFDDLDDKPEVWIDQKRKRVRILQHYYKEKGVWNLAYITHGGFLKEGGKDLNGPSNYLDEFGRPSNPIEMQSAYVDRQNNRYGEARSYIWLQDEVNHRHSKMLYLLSVRQVVMEEGAVEDVGRLKQELAKADGVIVRRPGMDLQINPTADMAQGQFSLMQEAKQEIESLGANSVLSGNAQQEMSGRAVEFLQRGGLSELSALFDGHKNWERRIYRQVWNRVKQFWDSEKWIRVTDKEGDLKWVGLNQPKTFGELLQEAAEAGSQEAAEALQFGIENQDPRLNEVVEIENAVAELDVDIIITEAPDFLTIRQEQFAALTELAKAYGPEKVPFEVMLKLSEIPGREEVEELLKGDPQAQAQAMELQQMIQSMQMDKEDTDIKGKKLENVAKEVDIIQKQIETEQLARAPASSINVNV